MRKRPDPPFFRVPRSTGKRNKVCYYKFPPPFTPVTCPQPPPSKVKYISLTQVVFFWITVVLKMSSQSHSFCIIYFRVKFKLLIILYGSLRSAALAKNLLSLALKILIITTSKSFYFNQDQEYILSLKQMF